jgi:hypothetical protein
MAASHLNPTNRPTWLDESERSSRGNRNLRTDGAAEFLPADSGLQVCLLK